MSCIFTYQKGTNMEKLHYSVFYHSSDGFFVCRTDFKDLEMEIRRPLTSHSGKANKLFRYTLTMLSYWLLNRIINIQNTTHWSNAHGKSAQPCGISTKRPLINGCGCKSYRKQR
jgi:hypothetical protein